MKVNTKPLIFHTHFTSLQKSQKAINTFNSSGLFAFFGHYDDDQEEQKDDKTGSSDGFIFCMLPPSFALQRVSSSPEIRGRVVQSHWTLLKTVQTLFSFCELLQIVLGDASHLTDLAFDGRSRGPMKEEIIVVFGVIFKQSCSLTVFRHFEVGVSLRPFTKCHITTFCFSFHYVVGASNCVCFYHSF